MARLGAIRLSTLRFRMERKATDQVARVAQRRCGARRAARQGLQPPPCSSPRGHPSQRNIAWLEIEKALVKHIRGAHTPPVGFREGVVGQRLGNARLHELGGFGEPLCAQLGDHLQSLFPGKQSASRAK